VSQIPEEEESDLQGSSSGVNETNHRDSSDALGDQLLEVVRRKATPMQGLPVETQKRRLAGFIQRRGHSWDTAKQILKQLGLMN